MLTCLPPQLVCATSRDILRWASLTSTGCSTGRKICPRWVGEDEIGMLDEGEGLPRRQGLLLMVEEEDEISRDGEKALSDRSLFLSFAATGWLCFDLKTYLLWYSESNQTSLLNNPTRCFTLPFYNPEIPTVLNFTHLKFRDHKLNSLFLLSIFL